MKQYLSRLLLALLLPYVLVAAFNTLVDPFGLWELTRVNGVNRFKSTFTDGLSLTKPHALQWRQPAVLLLGTSRVGEGLSCTMLDSNHCYNAALPGGSLYEAHRLQQQTVDFTHTIYLGLDFEAVLKGTELSKGFVENRFPYSKQATYNLLYPLQAARDYFSLLLAVDTTSSSLQTLWQQNPDHIAALSRRLDSDGSWELRAQPGAQDSVALAQQQGKVFRRIHAFSNAIVSQQMSLGEQVMAQRMDEYFRLLRAVADSARRSGARLQLFVNPSHALHQNVLYAQGAAPLFVDWLSRLQRFERRHEDVLEPVWNFTGYTQFNTSSLPGEEMNTWFNDPVHFSRTLGARMLESMQGTCPRPTAEPVGQRLRNMDLAVYREAHREAAASYSAQLQASGFL